MIIKDPTVADCEKFYQDCIRSLLIGIGVQHGIDPFMTIVSPENCLKLGKSLREKIKMNMSFFGWCKRDHDHEH
ncbi:MAG: hypothetical protein RLZZ74_3463 [Cyanobacteriota bacterium]